MNENTKAQLISIVQTFLAGFVFAIGTELVSGVDVQWTLAFLGSIALAGVRAGIKLLIEKYAPVALGGKK